MGDFIFFKQPSGNLSVGYVLDGFSKYRHGLLHPKLLKVSLLKEIVKERKVMRGGDVQTLLDSIKSGNKTLVLIVPKEILLPKS